jgi:hypothetical protein
MTDEEILKVDFYDLCGIGSIGMTDEEKITYWREVMENVNQSANEKSKKSIQNLGQNI